MGMDLVEDARLQQKYSFVYGRFQTASSKPDRLKLVFLKVFFPNLPVGLGCLCFQKG
jgi:hypothetical protein